MTELTIAAGSARALMDLAVAKGASRKALAERSGIDPAELQDQDNRVSFAKYVALMRVGKELCRDPALALHFGEAFDFAEMSIVGLIGRASETMSDGFAQFNRYARLVVDDGLGTDRLVLARSTGQLWMVDTRQYADDFPEFAETSFARMVCTSRRWFPEAQFIKAVHFTHPAPAYRTEYSRVFQLPVVFESDKNALLTDDAWLTHRNPHASRYVFGILSAHAEELLKSLESSKTTRGRVESLLMPILHTGQASVDVIAGKLGLSRQTLFRKLKVEGVTFEQVLDELRHKLALHYLSGKKVTVNETAYLVGFSESAAFSRAFKRWTGSSPHHARASKIDNDQMGSS
ncbi:MAG TPA: AraC family transcriptional regulator [Pyrinomonadaceae bacterium]|jgi:AraC-like DNA-binding protein|nr:AraC family transcriptional regulator [Pyrinomonadaceae bacterium]